LFGRPDKRFSDFDPLNYNEVYMLLLRSDIGRDSPLCFCCVEHQRSVCFLPQVVMPRRKLPVADAPRRERGVLNGG
jgi:hypothetical protein